MIKKVISDLNSCTGCSACLNVCHHHAVSLQADPAQHYGYAAFIDTAKCIDCGACRKVCPVLSPAQNMNYPEPDTYALYANPEVLEASASGGAFTLLAKAILRDQGCVIGAAYRENFSVAHIMIDSAEDLPLLQRSKYLQSDMGTIIAQIKKELPKRKVLFVGTPCQVAGVRKCIPSHENLFLVDLYCGHTPSNHLFARYLAENFDQNCLKSYAFRTKQHGWVSDTVTLSFTDNHTEVRRTSDDCYQMCYHSRLAMRKVCEACQFSGFPRQGDITIADFWWIEETYPEYANPMGVSSVLVNNPHGDMLFEQVRKDAAFCQKVSFSAMHKNRPAMVSAHPGRDHFYDLLKSKSFNEAVKRSMNNHFDIVLWGNWTERNYGSELTYYCLYQVLTSMGYDVLMVERPKDAIWGPNDTPVLFRNNPYPEYACFIPDSKTEMYHLNEMAETFMVGSDQIWHHDLYDCFGRVCYLEFVHPQKKKVAYSSSFGREYWDGNPFEINQTAALLNTFNAVSVREASGVSLCRDLFHQDAALVLDPLFLCSKDKLTALADTSDIRKDNYIGVYVLDEFKAFEPALAVLEEDLGLPAQIILDAFVYHDTSSFTHEILLDASIEDWISNFVHAEYIVTDSFHGMCLAILFQKPFAAISNSKRGSTRFKELLHLLHLDDRLLESGCDEQAILSLLHQPIDYSQVTQKLETLKNASINWLQAALKDDPVYENAADTDLLFNEFAQFADQFTKFSQETKKIQDWHTERLDHHDEIQNWHTTRLDENEKIQSWHTERLDEGKKIQDWHTERLDESKKIQDWHTQRLDHHDEIQDWHTKRLDHNDKIQKWHTDRLDKHDTSVNSLLERIELLERKTRFLPTIPSAGSPERKRKK